MGESDATLGDGRGSLLVVAAGTNLLRHGGRLGLNVDRKTSLCAPANKRSHHSINFCTILGTLGTLDLTLSTRAPF